MVFWISRPLRREPGAQSRSRPQKPGRDRRGNQAQTFSREGECEEIGDLIVYRQEFLDLPWRFEPLHDPLSSPRRLVRILGPIVQPFVLAVFHVQASLRAAP